MIIASAASFQPTHFVARARSMVVGAAGAWFSEPRSLRDLVPVTEDL
jgi:hypothetical protein